MSQIPWPNEELVFPNADQALEEPNGLLAAGGDLTPERLLKAYQQGIFPWYSEDQPILWWSPNPRCIVFPDQVHISKSLRKHMRKHNPKLTFNKAFRHVIRHCARLDSDEGTWITDEMEEAYLHLNELGIAHSVEVWEGQELVGGLYGLAIGRCFFGESMFSLKPNASKVAFTMLCRQLHAWNFQIIDCQVESPHLLTLGAKCIDRAQFLSILNDNIDLKPDNADWQFTLLNDND